MAVGRSSDHKEKLQGGFPSFPAVKLWFISQMHATIKNQVFGCLLPEVLYKISRKLQTAFSRVIFVWSSIIFKKARDFFNLPLLLLQHKNRLR